MSTKATHTLTITENNTTSSMPNVNEKLKCNIQAFKTKNGLLVLLQEVVGIICLVLFFIVGDQVNLDQRGMLKSAAFKYAIVAFFVTYLMSTFRTFLMILSYMLSPMTADILPKTIFEFLHNLVAVLCCGPLSLGLLIHCFTEIPENPVYGGEIALWVTAVLLSIMYGLSAILTYKLFKSA